MSDVNALEYVLKQTNMSKISGVSFGPLCRHLFKLSHSLTTDALITILSLLMFLSSLITG